MWPFENTPHHGILCLMGHSVPNLEPHPLGHFSNSLSIHGYPDLDVCATKVCYLGPTGYEMIASVVVRNSIS